MADYDSDSSGGDNDIETNVLLGYASKEPTIDHVSQLGGHPVRSCSKDSFPGPQAECMRRLGLTHRHVPMDLSPSARSATAF